MSFDGRDIAGGAAVSARRLGIGYVPEDPSHLRLLSVLENLRTGLDRPRSRRLAGKTLLDRSRELPHPGRARNQRAARSRAARQQMLAIARAMMLEPRIILLDEPTEGLMPGWSRRSGRSSTSSTRTAWHPARRAERAAHARVSTASHHGEGRGASHAPARARADESTVPWSLRRDDSLRPGRRADPHGLVNGMILARLPRGSRDLRHMDIATSPTAICSCWAPTSNDGVPHHRQLLGRPVSAVVVMAVLGAALQVIALSRLADDPSPRSSPLRALPGHPELRALQYGPVPRKIPGAGERTLPPLLRRVPVYPDRHRPHVGGHHRPLYLS